MCAIPNNVSALFVSASAEEDVPVTEAHVKDRRVEKTHRLLRDALVSLLHEKSYDSIVVKEILERANVGRSAFYAHFHDKDALLASGIHQMLHSAPLRPLPSSARRFGKAVWFSLPVFEYVDRFRHTADAKMGRRGRALVHQHLRQLLIEQIADDVRAAVQRRDAGAGEVPPDLLVEYVVGTFILVLNWWLESRSPLSPRDVDDLFLAMVVPTLAALVDDK
jgi:AcrR family transcriptional regulator